MKKPAESKHPGDFYKLKATIPADEAFRPLEGRRLPAGEAAELSVTCSRWRGEVDFRSDSEEVG